MSVVTIKSSVGSGGVNREADVRAVQELLNRFIDDAELDGPRLEPDGDCGRLTRGKIRLFQAVFLGHKSPDGRVDKDGPTLKALNDATTQPKLSDPDGTARSSVITTLRSWPISSMNFRLGGFQFTSSQYFDLANYFEVGRLWTKYEPSLGYNAKYHHRNINVTKGFMEVGFPSASSVYQKSIIIHECTHALCDATSHPTFLTHWAESLGHLAQAIYFFHAGGDKFPAMHNATARVLEYGLQIAERMYISGNTKVEQTEQNELYDRVDKLPTVSSNTMFVYDGI